MRINKGKGKTESFLRELKASKKKRWGYQKHCMTSNKLLLKSQWAGAYQLRYTDLNIDSAQIRTTVDLINFNPCLFFGFAITEAGKKW